VLTPPEAALGHSLGTGNRAYTFIPHDAALSQVGPSNVEPPSISGTPSVGHTLRADPGRWSARPEPQLSVRWLACDEAGQDCVRLAGEGQTTLIVSTAHVGSTLRILVTASNDAGSEVARSGSLGPVGAAPGPQPVRPAGPPPPATPPPDPPAPVPPSPTPPAPPPPPAPAPTTPEPPPTTTPGAPINAVLPSIHGLPRAGETLIGRVGRWTSDGPLTFEVNWLRCSAGGRSCVAIAGGSTLRVGDEHVGGVFKLEVVASNQSGGTRARSLATAPVAARLPVRPANVEPPAIRGPAQLGGSLLAFRGRWTGVPEPTFELQWLRCAVDGSACTAIDQATGPQYTLERSDVGTALALRVTASNGAGSATVDSVATNPVEGDPFNLEPPTFSGVARVNERLAATSGSWSGYPAPTFSYRWLRCDGAGDNCRLAHARAGSTLDLTENDAGYTFRVEVTAVNALGTASARSNPSERIRRAPVNTALPVVEIDFETTTFTASPGEWDGFPAPRFSYRWQYCNRTGCHDIRGDEVKGPVYEPDDGPPACDIRVIVTASNEAGSTTAVSAIVDSCFE
jgi:hypothetical protein